MNCSVNPNAKIRQEYIPGQLVLMWNEITIGIIVAKYKDRLWHDDVYTHIIMWVNLDGTLESLETWKPETWIASIIE